MKDTFPRSLIEGKYFRIYVTKPMLMLSTERRRAPLFSRIYEDIFAGAPLNIPASAFKIAADDLSVVNLLLFTFDLVNSADVLTCIYVPHIRSTTTVLLEGQDIMHDSKRRRRPSNSRGKAYCLCRKSFGSTSVKRWT